MKALRPSWGAPAPTNSPATSATSTWTSNCPEKDSHPCLPLFLHQQCPNSSPSRALSLATRAKVRGGLSQEPVSHCNYLRQALGSAPQALNYLLNTLVQSPLVFSLSPNRERNRNFEPPPRWGGSEQGLARCPSLGASEGHTVARHSCPSSPHGGPEPRPLCQGLRNSGWWQEPLPVSFLLPPFQVVSLA